MDAPQLIKNLIPCAYGWTKPKFLRIEQGGRLIYTTTAVSNAGGCGHTVYFPVNAGGRTLHAQEEWETLAGDATQAVESKTTWIRD